MVFTSPLDVANNSSIIKLLDGVNYLAEYTGNPSAPWADISTHKALAYSEGAPSTGVTLGLGPINVHMFNQDVPTFFPDGQPATASNNYVCPNSTITIDVFDDPIITHAPNLNVRTNEMPYRVIGSGYELRNTTAQLYKQGTLTHCRIGNQFSKTYAIANNPVPYGAGGNVAFTPVGVAPTMYTKTMAREAIDTFDLPPINVSTALRNGDCVVRNASDGIYAVNRYDMEKNPIVPDTRGFYYAKSHPALTNWDKTQFNNESYGTGYGYMPSTGAISPASGFPGNGPILYVYPSEPTSVHISPRDTLVTYMTGLSKESTFTLTCKFYIEMMPRSIDPEFAALTELKLPAPYLSNKALSLYNHISHNLPPCVDVRDNPSGEFWASIVKGITALAGTVLGAIDPGLAIPAMLLSQGGNLASKLIAQHAAAASNGTILKVAGQVGGVKSALMQDHIIKDKKKKKKTKKKKATSRAASASSNASRGRVRVRIA